jgi:hypothetical protein
MFEILDESSFSALNPLRIFLLLSSHFSIPKNIPLLHIQMPIKVIRNGRKNESSQKLLVNPVETVLAAKTVALATITEADAEGALAFELVTVAKLFKVVVPKAKFIAFANCA